MTYEHFYENDEADTHCLPACYRMAVGRQTGISLSWESAEEGTGYVAGKLTWQYAALLSWASDFGLYVVDYEDMNPEEFVNDPYGSIRRQVDDEQSFQYQIDNSDIDAEVERARKCLGHERIKFVSAAPSFDRLSSVVGSGATAITAINGSILHGQREYRPHSVVITSIEGARIGIDDPGPPSFPQMVVPAALFVAAWLNPSPTVANFLAVAREPIDV